MGKRRDRSALETVAEGIGVASLRMRIASDFTDEVSMLEMSLVELTNCREVLDNQIEQLRGEIDYAKQTAKRRTTKRLPKQTLRSGRSRGARSVQRRKAV